MRGGKRLGRALRGLLACRPCAAGVGGEDLLPGRHPGAPCAGGVAGRCVRHRAAPARRACPSILPGGHPQCAAGGLAPHVFAQVAGGVRVGDGVLDPQPAQHAAGQTDALRVRAGASKAGGGRGALVRPLSGCQCGYVLRKGWHEPDPQGRGTLSSYLSAFGVCACVLSFFAKSYITF